MSVRIVSRFLTIASFGLLLSLPIRFADSAHADGPGISVKKSGLRQLKRAIRQRGVGALDGGLASAIVKRTKKGKARNYIEQVSGTPPTLMSLRDDAFDGSVKNAFWREIDGENVIDAINGGSPTQAQCQEFWSSAVDGASGGLGACTMAESVGRSLGVTEEGFTSLCYMSNFPSAANEAAGGVEVLSGELPEGGITSVFAPGADTRIVKVLVGGMGEGQETVNLKVYGQSENQAEGNAYRVDLTFCNAENVARGYNRITISNNGRLEANVAEHGMDGSGVNIVNVSGFLQQIAGKATLDASKPRTANAIFTHEGEEMPSSFKGEIDVSGNTIRVRSFDSFAGSSSSTDTITRFSGSSPDSIRFTEGAFKNQWSLGDNLDEFSAAVEYRDSYYAATPESSLLTLVEGDFSDSFFQAPDGEIDTTGYECYSDDEAALVLSLDMSNPTVRESVVECEERPFNNMHFCYENREIFQAMDAFYAVCSGN